MNENELMIRKRKRMKALLCALIVALIGVGCETAVAGLRDTIVVYSGIKTYSIASLSAHAVMAAGTFLTFISLIRFIAAGKAVNTEQEKKRQEQAAKEASEPVLKIKGALDPVQIRNNLKTESDKWTEALKEQNSDKADEIYNALTEVMNTMLHMDDYQSRLKSLLDNNGAEALRDTEDILTNAEQHICRNIRKLLNIMMVSSPKNEDDTEMVLRTARSCNKDNNALLTTTKEFMVAVTELLNSQGDESGGIRELEAYKKAIASQINEGGIY